MDCIIVDFSILLSPVFQTPVLWFSTPRIAPIDAASLDRVYQALVPRDSKESLQRVGILGGISIAVRLGHQPVFAVTLIVCP